MGEWVRMDWLYCVKFIEKFLAEILVFNHFSVEFHRDLWTLLEVKAQKKLDRFWAGTGFTMVLENMWVSSKFGGRGRSLSQYMGEYDGIPKKGLDRRLLWLKNS